MSLEKIQQTLVTQLLTAFPTWNPETPTAELPSRIAWENVAFTPSPQTVWMRYYFMESQERIATLGPGGLDEVNGLVQIDLNYPVGVGEGDSREMLDTLRDCYSPGPIVFQDQSVTILGRNRSGGRTTDGFYRIPFTVRWRSFLTRS